MPREAFTPEDLASIEQEIARAEKLTSGEIRVFIDTHCKEDVLDHAAFVFKELQMHKTSLRNGVLIYIALKDHKFAILGDVGINQKVPADFWDSIRDEMRDLLKSEKHTEALIRGIRRAGEELSAHFPFQQGDSNELSNEIKFGR